MIKDLQFEFSNLKDLSDSKLEREELGVGSNFTEYAPKLRNIKEDFLLIDKYFDKLQIPEGREGNLLRYIQQLKNIISRIKNIQPPSNQNPLGFSTERIGIINEIQSLITNVNEFYDFATRARYIENTPEDFNKLTKALNKEIESTKKKTEEAEKILQGLRDASGKSGVTMSSSNFFEEAEGHKLFAKIWLTIGTIMWVFSIWITLAIFKGWWIFSDFSIKNLDNKNNLEIVHISVFKILIISLTYFILYQCLRNYKIHRHLNVLNKHRQNSLAVYDILINAAKEGEAKEIVVKEAAHAIFNTGATGYLDDDKTPPPINFQEIINRLPKL